MKKALIAMSGGVDSSFAARIQSNLSDIMGKYDKYGLLTLVI